MPAFTKNQRIEASSGGKTYTGYAHKVSGDSVTMRMDDGVLLKPQPSRVFRPSNAPPPTSGAPRQWKAKDRADFTGPDGVVRHGTLTSSGAAPRVVVDGAKEEFKVPTGLLRECTKPATVHPADPMDRWTVSSYRAVAAMSEETVAYTAKVLRDGRHVLDASNAGHGGCDTFRPVTNDRGVAAEFASAANDWFGRHGKHDTFEPDSSYVEWYATLRPYGRTAAQYVEDQVGLGHSSDTKAEAEARTETGGGPRF